MTEILNIFTGKGVGSVRAEIDDENRIAMVLDLPELREEPLRIPLAEAGASELGRALLAVVSLKAQREKDAADTLQATVRAVLHGWSRDGRERTVAYVTARVVSRTPFSARLRVVGTADWHPHRTKRTGKEFDVNLTTGEELGHREVHRRYWTVIPEHVERLKSPIDTRIAPENDLSSKGPTHASMDD